MILSSRKSSPKSPLKPPREERYAAPALEKGLDVLELLSADPVGLTQTQIADSMGRSASEIFRMLACLEQRGYISRSKPADIYQLTPKLFELSHRHPPTRRLLDAALPVMRAVAKSIHQSCHLAIRHHTDVTVVAQIDSPDYKGFSVRLGAQLPLLETTSGLVLLAFSDDEVVGELLAELLPSPSGRSEATARMNSIRRLGYEQTDSRTIEGIVDIGVPVLDHRGRAIAAFTVPCVTVRGRKQNWESIRRELLAAARQISAAVGGGDSRPV